MQIDYSTSMIFLLKLLYFKQKSIYFDIFPHKGLNEISISRKKLLHFSQRLLHRYEANIQAKKDYRKSNDSDVETNDIVYVVDNIQSSLG